MEITNYPGISERIKATMIDAFIMVILFFVFAGLFDKLKIEQASVKMIAFFFIVLFFEPLLVSIFGNSIGQYIVGVKVKRANDHSRNIIFPLAVIRYVVKLFLGIISFISVGGSETGRTIHDMLVDSVVLYRNRE